ncbi:hypothetical protein ACFL5K_02595 [Gemmatimonadota bacterium]
MDMKKLKLAGVSNTLILASGLVLVVAGFMVAAVSDDLTIRLLAALVFASGVVVLLLGTLLSRMDIFRQILRHVQYLTQSSEYSARLVREITEVMKAIQAAEEEEREEKAAGKTGNSKAREKEDPEIEKAVKQFEV